MEMLRKRKLTLSAFTLKLIAVFAMTIDHLAWAFIDENTIAGQVCHVVGRLTIPIMCFAISEGYIHTRNVKNYIFRLLVFGSISIVPFYMFFGDMYGYRQNIIIDLMMALLALYLVNLVSVKIPAKIIGLVVLISISLFLGGWPVMPILYVLIFYFFRNNYKKICIWFITVTVIMVAAVVSFTLINDYFGWFELGWKWYDKFYLLGFILPLPLFRFYNGEKGGGLVSPAAFYIYYPLHLLILSGIFRRSTDLRLVFILVHVAALLLLLSLLLLTINNGSTKVHFSFASMLICGMTFMFGYFIELLSPDLISVTAAVKVEYVAECGFIMCLIWFIANLLRIKVPVWIYLSEGGICIITTYSVLAMEYCNWFYTSFTMDYSWAFPMAKISPGPVYYLFYASLVVLSFAFIVVGLIKRRKASYIEGKRIALVLASIIMIWGFVCLKIMGFTKYDMISLGVLASMCCLAYAMMKYGFANPVQVAAENFADYCREGILVIDMSGEVMMVNDNMVELFPQLEKGRYLTGMDGVDEIINGRIETYEKNGKVYEFRKQPIMKDDKFQGYMFWATDVTDHRADIKKIQSKADKDSLTQLYNREYFEEYINGDLRNGVTGSMFMLDLDNFKAVNDNYGHGVGDAVLISFARHLKECLNETEAVFCRLGGDEFMIYIPNETDKATLEKYVERIIFRLPVKMSKTGLPVTVGTSLGIYINEGNEKRFKDLYFKADIALYYSKNHGKNTYRFYDTSIDTDFEEK